MPFGLTPEATAILRDAWADLATRALEPSIFNDPAFALPAVSHLPGRRPPRVLIAWDARDASRLIGLCCLAPAVPGLPLSAWLHAQATAAFPLLDRDQPGEALEALVAQTSGWFRPAGLTMHGLPVDGATMRLIAGSSWSLATLESRDRAVLRAPPPGLAGKAGKEFRRQARRLAELGRTELTTAVANEASLEAFLALEARGWKGRRGTALAAAPRRARFVRDMVLALASEGRCRIHALTLDGRPIAMGVVLHSGARAFFWKTAYDEGFARFSPGAHLAAAIGDALRHDPDLDLIDSCAIPGHSMIDRLWPERMTVVDAVLAPAPATSISHRVVVGAELARRAGRRWAKHIVNRAWP